MGTTLHTLKGPRGATRNRKRIGRGRGSGTGKTSGKGVKGQKARTGHHGARFGFEGGQMPMPRRIPKRGFKNPFRVETFAINVGALDKLFEAGTVDVDALHGAGMVPRSARHREDPRRGRADQEAGRQGTGVLGVRQGEDREGRRHRRAHPVQARRRPQRLAGSDRSETDGCPVSRTSARSRSSAGGSCSRWRCSRSTASASFVTTPGVNRAIMAKIVNQAARGRSSACSTCSRAARSSRCRSSRSASCRTSARRSSCSC